MSMEKSVFERLLSLETPVYYYDMDLLKETVDSLAETAAAHGVKVHYAVKTNNEERIMRYIASKGLGADCVSGNEIAWAVHCGFAPESIVYAGVGKTDKELNSALLAGIGAFNCESPEELRILDELAGRCGRKARVCLRINPDIDAHTHHYITTGLEENKFGISRFAFEEVVGIVKSSENLIFTGLHFHIGSQITSVREIFAVEVARAEEIVGWFESRGLRVDNIDLGGGLGIDYEDPDGNPVPDFKGWIETVSTFRRRPDQILHIEPGRSIAAQCGSLLSRVVYVKKGETKDTVILDAGMNNLIRPALYGAYHKVENLSAGFLRKDAPLHSYDVAGPVCESADVFGTKRLLPETVRGDLVAIRSAGAYGSVMSSRYNMRGDAPAVFSDEI